MARFSSYGLSALFFISGFFMVFAPIPLIFMYLRRGALWALLSAVTNGLFVFAVGDLAYLSLYFVLVVVTGLMLPLFLSLKWAIEKAVVATLAAIATAMLGTLAGYARFYHVNPITQFKEYLGKFADYVGQSLPAGVAESSGMNPEMMEAWKAGLIVEFPSAVAIFCLIVVVTSLVVVLRANPNGIRDKLGLDAQFTKTWKAPFFLVWPTIVAGALLIFEAGVASDVALNGFKFLMAVFALQGLSILSFIFDVWGLKGIFRFGSFFAVLFLMMPMVLSLGFFDLWFDFRAKFRQS